MSSLFQPAWFLNGPHRQTMFPTVFRKDPKPQAEQLLVDTPDGDFLDLRLSLNWQESQAPIVFIFHGLEGSFDSKYASGLFQSLSLSGFRVVFMHFRNCGPYVNKKMISYHAAATDDLKFLFKYFRNKFRKAKFAGVGFSIGGNVLLNYMAQTKSKSSLSAAVTVSVPYDLKKSVVHIHQAKSRIYEHYLMYSLRRAVRRKIAAGVFEAGWLAKINKIKTIYEFDEHFTAPIHGFGNAENYYRIASSGQYINQIKKPTLLIHAKDDPFMPVSVIPDRKALPHNIKLELSHSGGHVGFVSGGFLNTEYWLEQRVLRYLKEIF